jgi:tryptophanyl-tRNA synthetase
VLSGIQPTSASFHIGNYIGALRQWAALQDEHEEVFYFLADLHALTLEPPTPADLTERSRAAAAQLIASGVDPERSAIFAQSHIAAHTQLSWVFECLTGEGEARRMTQFKDKAARGERVSVGLLTYPILQAADILIYQAHYVPVGEDQRQHVELTRDLAQRFNARYGETFVVPEAYITPEAKRIVDLQDPTAKMSKSSSSPSGIVELLDDPKVSAKKVRSAVTDSGREIVFDEEGKPGVSNLLTIHSALTGRPVDELVQAYAGRGYGDLKRDVAEAVTQFVTPFRERTQAYLDDPETLDSILARGAEKATAVAAVTLETVYDRVGFLRAKR